MADDGKGQGDDREANEDGFDAWAELEADATPDLGEGLSISFDEVAADAVLEPDLDAGLDAGLDTGPAAEGLADDAVVDAWLQEPLGDPAEAMPLSVFVPDDPADTADPAPGGEVADAWPHDPAAVEIGSGPAGVSSASDIDVLDLLEADEPAAASGGDAVFDAATVDVDPAEPVETIAFAAVEGDGEQTEADIIDFGTAAAGVATLAAAAADDGVADDPAAATKGTRGPRGLIGRLLGLALAGLLAIPLVLAMLIGLMWTGWKDPVGLRDWVPQQLAFLLPEPRPVAAGLPRAVDLVAAPLPDEPAAAAAPVAEPREDAEPMATAEPAPEVGAAPVAEEPPSPAPLAVTAAPEPAAEPAEPKPALPGDEVAAVEPAAAPMTADPAPGDPPAAPPSAPAVGDLAAIVPPPAATTIEEPAPARVVEPEPLDLGSLEAAVAAATAALDEVKSVADPADPSRKVRLVNWYRQLARVAQELARLEHVAVESGRPLPATPAPAADLGGRLLATPELAGDLARLARNWLTYSRRDADGVVMPATFAGARRVGPYWCSRVSIPDAAGSARELAVISRVEPAAAPGDAVIVMGLVMDGGVLWASDLRSAAAAGEPAAAVESDPFAQPGL